MSPMSFRSLPLTIGLGLLLAMSVGVAPAADLYWDTNGTTANGDGTGAWRGGTGNALWSTNASGTTVTGTWSAIAGTGSATVQFGFGPAPANLTNGGTVSIGNSNSTANMVTCGAIIFNASGNTGYYFQNNAGNPNPSTVTLNATGTSGVSAGTGLLLTDSITGDITFGKFGGGTGGTGSNIGNVGSAVVVLAKAQTWTNNSTGYALVMNGPVTGAFGLTTNGPGTIIFGGSNTFSSLTASAGTVRVTNAGGLSSGAVTVGSAATLNVLAPVTNSIASSGTIAIGPGGGVTASSLGAGALTIAGVSGSTATFTDTLSSGTLNLGTVGMGGSATIAMPVASSILSSGAVTLSGADNLLSLSGVAAAGNTYTLLQGSSLANTGAISVTGAAVGNQTIALGNSVTVGRTTYSFTSTANALRLVTTGSQVTLTWTGATNNVWDYSTNNWTTGTGNTYFGSGDNGRITSAAAITVRPEGVVADALTVSNGSGTASLTGGSVTASSITKSGNGGFAFDNAVTAGSVTLSGGATTVSGTGSLSAGTLANNASLVIASSGVQTLAAAMSGTGSLAYTGGSTLSLTGVSSFNGGLAIGAGSTLRLAGPGVLGSGSFGGAIANEGTLDLSGTSSQTLAGAISGGGSVTKAGGSTVTLSGNNSYTGSTSVTAGTLQLGSGSALGTADGSTSVSTGAALDLNGQSVAAEAITISGTGIVGSGAGALTNSSTAGAATWGGGVTLGSAATGIGGAGSMTIAGSVVGSGGMVKVGEGTVSLSGANSFGGTLNILAGTVQVASPASLPNVPLTWSSSASSSTLDLVGSGSYAMTSMAMGSILRVKTSGSGQATLAINNDSTLGGSANKTLQADQNVTVVVNGMIDLASTSTRGRSAQFQGAGDIVLNGAVIGGGTNQFGIIKNADFANQTGTLFVNGANSYNGVTQITGGTLKIGNPLALGSAAAGTTLSSPFFSGAALDLNGQAVVDETLSMNGATADPVDFGVALVNSSATPASWSGAVAVVAGGASGIGGSGDITVTGSVTGGGDLRKVGVGSVTLSTAFNTGSTFVDEGTLTLGAGSVVTSGGAIVVASGASLNVLGSASGYVASQGTIAIGPGGRLTSPDFGGGDSYYGVFSVVGSAGSTAILSDTGTSGFVNRVASVTMGGDAQIDLVVGSSITASGPVAISGANNLLSLSGVAAKGTTYALLSGSSILNTGAIAATGALLGNQTVALGSSKTVGRSTYSFTQSGTSLLLTVTGSQFNLTWTGSTSNVWDYSTVNWQSGGTGFTFDPGDNATIASAATIVVDAAGVTSGTTTVSNATGTVDLSGGTLTTTALVKSGNGLLTANGNVAVTNGITLSGGTFQIGAAGSLSGGSYSGPIANNAALVFSGTANQTFGGTLSGTGSLTHSGAGTLFLTGTSTSTGRIAVAAGSTLKVSDGGVLGSGPVANDGSFVVSSTASQTLAGTISGSGSVTVQTGTVTPATITLAGNNSYTGATTVGSGTLQLGSATALGSAAVGTTVTAGGVLDLNGQTGVAEPLALSSSGIGNSGALVNSNTGAAASVAGTVTLNDTSTGLGGAGNTTLTGLVTGSGGLTKWGEGTLTLSGSATYGGVTSIQAGTLRVQNPAVLVSSTLQSNNSASSATFDMATSGTYSTGFLLLGQILRVGTSGTGPATLAAANGMLNGNIDKVLEVGSNATVLVSGTFDLRNTGTATRNLVTGGAGNAVFNGVISGTSPTNPALQYGIFVGGSATTPVGMTTLNAANTYNGPTTVSTGTLRLGNAQALGSTSAGTLVTTSTLAPSLAGGVLDLNGQAIVGESLTLNGSAGTVSLVNSSAGAAASWSTDIAASGSVAIGGAGGISLPGNVTGAASLTKIGAGRVTLAGNNTYAGPTAVASGTLAAGSATAIPSASAVSVATGATLDLGGYGQTLGALSGSGRVLAGGTLTVGAGNASSAFNGVIAGTGRLSKVGAGTLSLGGVNTLTGSTTVQQGTLQLANGAALASSRVIPLAGGTLSLTPYLQTTVGGLAPNAGGLTDVGSGMVTVAGGLSAADMVTAIVTGMGDGTWNGTSGITSSVAASVSYTHLTLPTKRIV